MLDRIYIPFEGKQYLVQLQTGIDLSIPLKAEPDQVSAWYVPPISMEPVRGEGFVGSVAEGGSVNFRNISFNPHGHGTHTECVGHITKEIHSVNQLVKDYHLLAELITIKPEKINSTFEEGANDLVITKKQLETSIQSSCEAVILRTLPNPVSKKKKNYSSSNPPYITKKAMLYLVERGTKHLLIDLPSVDRELDGGLLEAHHLFWVVGGEERRDCSITELIYVPSEVEDGVFYLNLQFPPFENDASPSRPVIYPLISAE